MWWLAGGIVVGGVILFFVWRNIRAGRRRVTRWENLHERSKMIAAHLSQLKDVQARKRG